MMTFPIDRMKKAALMALLLASTSVGAHSPQSARTIRLPLDSKHAVPAVYVAGGMATTLRFEYPCDPSRTKLLGWEGRFEPLLVGGRSVVIVPLKAVEPEDRFLLLVTLMDGTELPFTIMGSKNRRDGQVNIYPDPESPEAIRATLEEKLEENKALRDENSRREQEETSVDHALATLLTRGKLSMTPFQERQKWALNEEDLKADVIVLDGGGRAAVIFKVKNLDPEKPWKLEEARLSTFSSWESRPFALRMTPTEIRPGETGHIAIVTDKTSFDTRTGMDKLVLELFRNGGLRQAYVVLENRLEPRRSKQASK